MRNFRLILKEVTCHGIGFGDWFVCCGDCRDSARHGLCQGGWSGGRNGDVRESAFIWFTARTVLLLAAALPIALVGYFSAIAQGKCAAGSMLMVGRRPEMQGKGMMMTAMVETYAVLALLISFLCVNAIVL